MSKLHVYTLAHTLSQRSIEDEIERESQAEITTILISYILMFVYIMFFLGHIRGIKTLLVRGNTMDRGDNNDKFKDIELFFFSPVVQYQGL